MISGFCPACGAQRGPGAYCASCGFAFGTAPTVQQGVAGGMLELEKMRGKLILGRLVGIAIGLAIWWFLIGPTFADNPLIISVGLIALVFGGMHIGTLAVLAQQRK